MTAINDKCKYCGKSEPCEGAYPEGCLHGNEKLKYQADTIHGIWKNMDDCPLKEHLTKWFGFDGDKWDALADRERYARLQIEKDRERLKEYILELSIDYYIDLDRVNIQLD